MSKISVKDFKKFWNYTAIVMGREKLYMPQIKKILGDSTKITTRINKDHIKKIKNEMCYE